MLLLREGDDDDHHVPGQPAQAREGLPHVEDVLERRVVEDHVEALCQLRRQDLREVQEELLFPAGEATLPVKLVRV